MKKKNIILGIVAIVLMAGIFISYSFFSANVKYDSKTTTLIRSKKLALVFEDTKEVNVDDVIPGDYVIKTFKVTSDADDEITYNIKLHDIISTFGNDLVYTIKREGVTLAENIALPNTSSTSYVLTGLNIAPGETQNFEVEVRYLYLEDEEQDSNGRAFNGTFTIDADPVKKKTKLSHHMILRK